MRQNSVETNKINWLSHNFGLEVSKRPNCGPKFVSVLKSNALEKGVRAYCVKNRMTFTEACFSKDLKYIQKLVENGAEVNQIGKYGRNGLLWAVVKGNKDIIKFLHSRDVKKLLNY